MGRRTGRLPHCCGWSTEQNTGNYITSPALPAPMCVGGSRPVCFERLVEMTSPPSATHLTAESGRLRTVPRVDIRRPRPKQSAADAEIAAHELGSSSVGGSVSALSSLQRRMEVYPQLSPEAQSELAGRYRAASTAADDPAASKSARAAAHREAERCLEFLSGANFRLVQLIAREKAQERFGLAKALEMLPDLVAEGMVALTEAARTYDQATCPPFTKYAQAAVRNHIRASIANSGPLRVTSSVSRMKRIATKRKETLTEQMGRPPTREELQGELLTWCLAWAEGRLTAQELTLSDDARHEAKMAKLRKQGMLAAIANIDEVLAYAQSLTSLSSPVGDGSATLSDLMPSSMPDEMFDTAELGELNRLLLAALEQRCSGREQDILRLRFGLDGTEAWTYARIAPKFGLTAERIRQIERIALTKLAEDPRLAAFLPELDLDA